MGSGSAWTARVLGATTSSSSGSGDRSSTRRSTSELTAPSPRPVLRSAGISTSTTHADRIRALTGGRRIEPTSPSCRRSRRPEPGRPSTYQSGKPVPTNRASSVLEGPDDLVVGEHDPVPGQQGAQGLDRSRLPVDQGAVAVEGEGGHTGEIGGCHAGRPCRKPIVTPPPYHTADLGLPGLIPSGRGDDQDHAARGDVGPPRAPATAPEARDRATLPRPPPLPRGRALARADRCAVARPTTRADELAHRL